LTLAQLLSDLVTLRVSDPSAALNLVSARPSTSPSTAATINDKNANKNANEQHKAAGDAGRNDEEDKDLQRAKDLVKLHYEVKVAHSEGRFGKELEAARELVSGV
ncbi:hypothetical protein DM02DRAFT_502492, partial [Periconia macrospinosa]